MNRPSPAQRFYGPTIVAACFLIQGIGIGGYIAYGVFFPSLLESFGWSRTMISGASSMAFLLMGFLGIPAAITRTITELGLSTPLPAASRQTPS